MSQYFVIRPAMRAGFFLFLALVVPALAVNLSQEERMQFADGLFSRGLYKLAIEEYEKLLEVNGEYGGADAAYYRLGDAYRHIGDSGQAQKHYSKVVNLFPDSDYAAKAGLKRADIFVGEKRYEEGVVLYRMVLKKRPGEQIESACHFFIGEALFAAGKTNDAEKAYATIAKDFSSSEYNPFALLRLAEIGSARGSDLDAVLRYYRAASTNGISSRAAAEALYQIGRLEFQRREFEESSRAFAELAERYPGDRRTGESKLDAAWAQYSAGYTAKSLALAEAALREPDATADMRREWLYLKANSERGLKKSAEAIRTYTALIELGGGEGHAYTYERALCHFELGNYGDVTQALSGLNLKESRVAEDVLWLLGRASEESSALDDAVQYYRKLIREFADGKFVGQSSFRLAGILRGRKDWKGAEELYAKVAKDFPDGGLGPKALLAGGLCSLEGGDLEGAVSFWKTLQTRYPSDLLVPESLLNLAAAEVRLKRPKAAAGTVSDFLERFPAHTKAGEAWFWKGLIGADQGRHKEAEKAFTKALELGVAEGIKPKASAYRALAIYRGGDHDRAADDVQKLSGEDELRAAGRNIFAWLARYRLQEKDAEKAVDAGKKLAGVSDLPIEKQEAFCVLGRAAMLGKDQDMAGRMFMSAYQIEEASIFRAEAALALAEFAVRDRALEKANEYFATAAELAGGADGVAVRARAYIGLGDISELGRDFTKAARYFMSVAVLFDDEVLVPRALKSAARCYAAAGMDSARDQALSELAERYPKASTGGDRE